jgi:NADH-quinone oxidoreductase subunit L
VYLVGRTFFFFEASATALTVVALIGLFTALLAATIAVAQDDIKRILAYSTISQLGYMMLGLGAGDVSAGIFHLTTHAWFKALLFLMAGSAIHAVHTNSIWEMGGLGRKMKITALVGLVGGLALAGLPPLSGFYSKESILSATLASHALAQTLAPAGRMIVFALAMAGIFLTAFYIFRLWFVTFLGKPRAHGSEAHESPYVMTLPMIALALLSISSGWVGDWLMNLIRPGHVHPLVPAWMPILKTLIVVAGIGTAWLLFSPARAPRERPTGGAVYTFLQNHWYIDYAYHWAAWKIVLGMAAVLAWVDRHVVDGMVNGVAWLAGRVAAGLRRSETGQLQLYALLIVLGALIAGMVFTSLRLPPGAVP